MKDTFYNLQNKHLQIKFWVVSSWLDGLKKKKKHWRPKKKQQQSECCALNQSRLWLSLSWAAFNFSSSVLTQETHGSRLETSSLVIHPNSRLKYVGCFYHLQRGDAMTCFMSHTQNKKIICAWKHFRNEVAEYLRLPVLKRQSPTPCSKLPIIMAISTTVGRHITYTECKQTYKNKKNALCQKHVNDLPFSQSWRPAQLGQRSLQLVLMSCSATEHWFYVNMNVDDQNITTGQNPEQSQKQNKTGLQPRQLSCCRLEGNHLRGCSTSWLLHSVCLLPISPEKKGCFSHFFNGLLHWKSWCMDVQVIIRMVLAGAMWILITSLDSDLKIMVHV